MDINDRIITPDGPGVIIGVDLPDTRVKRYIVKLDIDKYTFNPEYWPNELRKIA